MAIEQAACFFELTPGDEDSSVSASVTFEADIYDAATPNEALLEVTPQPGVSSGLGLSPPDDAGSVVPTATPGRAWIIVRYGGQDRYIAQKPVAGGLPTIEAALAGMAFSFGVPSRAGDNLEPWTNWESSLQGLAPPGTGDLDVLVEYDFAGTLVRVPLITGGRSWASSRPLFGNPLLITGKGLLSRHHAPKVSYLAKAGHGLSHGELLHDVLSLTTVDESKIEVDASFGESLTKRLELDCESAVDAAAKIAESYGYRLLETRAGGIVARHAAPVDFQPAATIRIDRADINADVTVNVDWEGIPSCLAVEGNRPEIPADTEGLITTPWRTESEKKERIALPVAQWSQQSGGTFNAVSGPPPNEQVLVTERIEVRETFFQGCLQVRERKVWGWYNPQTWRYQTFGGAGSLDGKPYTYNVGAYSFEASSPSIDDSSPVYRWTRDRFVVIQYEREEYIRDGEDGREGRLIQVKKGTGRWQYLEEALRFASAGTPADWSAENVRPNIKLLGDGTPVYEGAVVPEELWIGPFDSSNFSGDEAAPGSFGGSSDIAGALGAESRSGWAESVVIDIAVQDVETSTSAERPGGYETSRTEVNRGWEKTNGGGYLYRDGTESDDSSLIMRPTLTTRRSFIPEGGGTHTEVATQEDGEGRPLPTNTRPGQPSHLPIADVCNREMDRENQTVTVRGVACLPEGLVDPPWTDTLSYDFGVETAAQADRLAEIELRRLVAADVPLTLPINAQLSVLDPIRLEGAALGIDPDVWDKSSNAWVEEIEHVDERDEITGAVRRVSNVLLKWSLV